MMRATNHPNHGTIFTRLRIFVTMPLTGSLPGFQLSQDLFEGVQDRYLALRVVQLQPFHPVFELIQGLTQRCCILHFPLHFATPPEHRPNVKKFDT